MGNYSSSSYVAKLVPYYAIGASTTPSSTTVDEWVDQAEAELDGVLIAQGGTTPITGTRAINMARSWVSRRVKGQVLEAYASAGGDPANDNGAADAKWWDELIKSLRRDATVILAELGQGDAGTDLSSYVTDNSDGLTSSSFEPSFKRSEVF